MVAAAGTATHVPLKCVVHPAVAHASHPPCKLHIQVEVQERGEELEWITFTNYYTAQVTIKQLVEKTVEDDGGTCSSSSNSNSSSSSSNSSSSKGGEGGATKMVWTTVLHKRPLMHNPHYEDDAQRVCKVGVGEFNHKFRPTPMMKLRMYLYQPSPLWKNINITMIQCFASKFETNNDSNNSNGVSSRSSSSSSNSGDLGLAPLLDDLTSVYKRVCEEGVVLSGGGERDREYDDGSDGV